MRGALPLYHDGPVCVLKKRQIVLYLSSEVLSSLQDGNGQTAVHLAAVSGSIRCLKILISKNSDLRMRDIDGR